MARWSATIAAVIIAVSTARAGAEMVDITKPPESVSVVTDDGPFPLLRNGDAWADRGVTVETNLNSDGAHVTLSAADAGMKKIILKWPARFDADTGFLGDAWERAYGELQWAPADPKRAMPWYFFATDGDKIDGYGVMTGPASMCCWKVEPSGITLTADVRSGGVGVQLGRRVLNVCTIVDRAGLPGERPFVSAQNFCKQMCPHPRLPLSPVYGFNDWYCKYGKNTAGEFLKDAAFVTSLCPTQTNQPYMVVDDGWQGRRQGEQSKACPWDHTNDRFGSTMPDLSRQVHAISARSGLWYRPLQAWPDAPAAWRLADRKETLDPTVPDVKKQITRDVTRFREWGFDLLKHDFTTNEITGQWGFQMGDQFGRDGWSFADKSQTTAEILIDLYRTIREAAGDQMIVDGCNTVGHLAAGINELQRIGDDTSGTEWDRTRDMGVNCLAFRGPQQGAFYFVDADCAGLAKPGAVPWDKNRQWLDLLGRSGTPLFVSWPQQLVRMEQQEALTAALKSAASAQPVAEPVDWTSGKTPRRWIIGGQPIDFDWSSPVKAKR